MVLSDTRITLMSNRNGQQPSRGESEQFVLSTLPEPKFDFHFENHFSICLLRPLTEAAHEWMSEHLPIDNPNTQFWGEAIVIEARYASDVLLGLQSDGLTVLA
jgi:hypothetical protein